MTYTELLNLSMEEFNAKDNKTIQEIILYLYHKYKFSNIDDFIYYPTEIYKAYVDMDIWVYQLLISLNNIIDSIDCEDCIEILSEIKMEFMDKLQETGNPLKHWPDFKACASTFIDTLDIFFGILIVLEDWEYDLSKLLKPNIVKKPRSKAC